MFDEVLSVLLDRIPERTPAAAPGWRAVTLPGRVYPGLIASPTTTAHGLLITSLSADEWTILDAFEDEVYELRQLNLTGHHGWAYTCADQTTAGNCEWDAHQFRRAHLPAYVAQCRRWRGRGQVSAPATLRNEAS